MLRCPRIFAGKFIRLFVKFLFVGKLRTALCVFRLLPFSITTITEQIMILLLSPAKTLDYSPAEFSEYTQPRLTDDSQLLINLLREKSHAEIKGMMKISDKLAELNLDRFRSYEQPFTPENAKQALLAFKGDVYTGLNTDDFTDADLLFSQQCVRTLSGLYGLLRPLDLMQPYRLEMGTRAENERGKNLYEFWGDKITNLINADLVKTSSDTVVNLASQEYFKAVKTDKVNGKIVTVHFKEERDGKLKIIAFNAKKARGMMTRFVVKNRLEQPVDMKAFNEDNYIFNDEISTDDEYFFTR